MIDRSVKLTPKDIRVLSFLKTRKDKALHVDELGSERTLKDLSISSRGSFRGSFSALRRANILMLPETKGPYKFNTEIADHDIQRLIAAGRYDPEATEPDPLEHKPMTKLA